MDEPPEDPPHSEVAPTRSPGSRGGWDAFISYSHSADTDLAPALRDGLHKLAKPWHHKRAMRVFLDDASLSADPTLWTPIARAIDSASGFVALLSPEAAASVWVNREIRQWVERCGSDRLFPVLTRGELFWNETLHDYDPERSTALPEALRGVFAEEPRHIDVRWADGRLGLTLEDLQFRDTVAELAAPLRNVPKDELIGNDLEEHRRAIRLARAAIVVLSVLLVAAVLAAVSARSNAVRADSRRIDAQAARLRLEALGQSTFPDRGFLLAAEAYRLRPDAANTAAVVATAQRMPDLRRYIRVHDDRVVAVGITADSRTVVSLDRKGLLVASDAGSGATSATAHIEANGGLIAADGTDIIVSGLGVAERRDARTLKVKQRWAAGGGSAIFSALAVISDSRVAFSRQDGHLAIAAVGDDRALKWKTTAQKKTNALTVAPDGQLVMLGVAPDDSWVIDRVDGANVTTPRWRATTTFQPRSLSMNGDGSLVIVGLQRGAFLVLDATTGKPIGKPTSFGTSAVLAVASSAAVLRDQIIATEGGDLRYLEARQLLYYPDGVLFTGAATSLAWSPGGIAVAGGADGVVVVMNTGPNRATAARDLGLAAAIATISADGTRTIGVVGDEVIESSAKGRRVVGHVGESNAIAAFGADDVVVGDTHGVIHLFVGGKELTAGNSGSAVIALASVGSDRLLSLTGDQRLQLWSVRNGRLVLDRTLSDRATAFSLQGPDGPAVAYFERGSGLVVGDLDGNEIQRVTIDQEKSLAVALDPTGLMAVTSEGSLLHVWNVAKGTEQRSPLDARGDVRRVQFVDDGRRIIAADAQSSVTLTDVASGAVLGQLADEDGPILGSFAASNRSSAYVVSSATDGVIRTLLRSFDPAAILADSCRVFGRPFTSAEQDTFDLGGKADPCGA